MTTSVTDELYNFQREAVEFAATRPGAAIFCEQGTGKTHIIGGLIERLLGVRECVALVIVPLANVETTWVRLLERLDVTLCRSWASFKATRGSRVLLLHYEALKGKKGVVNKLLRSILRQPWTLVAYDESQRLKARASKASRASARFKSVDHRVILSGTPIEQCPQDLWAQLRFCAPKIFGTVWSRFDVEWLRPCGFMGYDREFLWHKLPQFLALVRPVVFRVTKRQVLSLQPVKFVVERVELLGDQARVYRELADDQTSVLVDGRRITCDMTITQLVRLQQVVGGFVRDEFGESVVVGQAKARRLTSVLRRYKPPVVVFCKYREEVETCDRIARLLGFVVGRITGKTRKTRSATVDAFQRGEIDVLVCQVRSGGVGVNLHRSCVGVFYSAPFSHIDFDQAICRLDRNGQLHPVTIVLIQGQNTVDEVIREALLMKKTVSSQVLEDHRRIQMAKPEPKKTEPAKPAGKPAPGHAPASTPATKPALVKPDAASTAAKPEGEKKKPTPPPQPERPKFGVPELAQVLDIKPASVRVRLRNAAVPKSTKLYGWDTQEEMMKVAEKIRNDKPKETKPKDGTAKEAAEPEEGDDDGEDDGEDEDGDD